MLLRTFGWSLGITVLGLVAAGLIWGGDGFGIVAILAILEISLSFDNAVVNATVLKRMSPFWQRIFLTVGVLIAVFGMRLIFPIIVVALTSHMNPWDVVNLAINHGTEYGHKLDYAHPGIAAFGGMFLLMIFLDFMLDDEKEHHWLGWLERPLAKIGKLDQLSVVISLVALGVCAITLAGDRAVTVLLAGVFGLATYLAVGGVSELFESQMEEEEEEEEAEEAAAARKGGTKKLVLATGKAALFMFLYLEVLDASFSFDGVVGAFAISSNIFQIALGLGIGAMYIRSLTVYLVRQGTLDDYVYLEHGAHYAIGALAIILLISIEYSVPEVVTGLIGVAFIAAALLSSVVRNRREGKNSERRDEEEELPSAV